MVAQYNNGRVARSMVRVPGSGGNDDLAPICLNLGIVSNFAAMVPVAPLMMVTGRKGRQQLQFAGSQTLPPPSKLTDGVPQGVIPCEETPEVNSGILPNSNVSNLSSAANNCNYTVMQSASEVVPSMMSASSSSSSSSSSLMTSSRNANVVNATALKRPRCVGQSQESESHLAAKRLRIAATTLPGVPHETGNASNWNAQVPFTVLPLPTGIPIGIGQQQTNGQSAVPAYAIQAGSANSVAMNQGGMTVSGPFVVVPVQQLAQLLPQGSNPSMQLLMQDRDRLRRENDALKYRLARFHQLMRNKDKLRTVLRNMNVITA